MLLLIAEADSWDEGPFVKAAPGDSGADSFGELPTEAGGRDAFVAGGDPT